jgi:hypothetical protein
MQRMLQIILQIHYSLLHKDPHRSKRNPIPSTTIPDEINLV